MTKNYKSEKEILDRDDAWVTDDFIINTDNSWMKDKDVLNFPYGEWRDGRKEKKN